MAARALLSAGLVTLDVIAFEDRTFHAPGGTAGNVAAMVAWLGSSTAVAGRLGSDAACAVVEQELERLGVDRDLLIHDTGETMRVVHEIRRDDHQFSLHCIECGRRVPRHRQLTAPHVERLAAAESRFSALLLDRATPALASLAESWATLGKMIVFEPWRRPNDAILATMLATADLVKVSGTPDLVAALDAAPRRSGGVDVVTLGADGARWRVDGGEWQTQPAPPAHVVDTAGAGDWLTATLLHSAGLEVTANPDALARHLSFAQAVSSLSVRYPGALGLTRAVPRNELDAVLAGRREPPPTAAAALTAVQADDHTCSACLRPLDA